MLVNSSPLLDQFKVDIRFTDELGLPTPEIETSRLYIRSYRDEDFKNSMALYSDVKITKYFDSGKPKSQREVENLIKHYRNSSENGLLGLFSVFKKDCKSFIGHLDLAPSDKPGIIEVGYIFNANFHNQGLCTEAIRAILFDYMSAISSKMLETENQLIKGVMATAHPDNLPSIKVLNKIGMKFERFLEKFGNPRLEYYLAITTNN